MRFDRIRWLLAGVTVAWMAFAGAAAAQELTIQPEKSIIAVVTHKGGFAASQAHNHLISIGAERAVLTLDPESALASRFELAFDAKDLLVDDWDQQQAWYPRLEELDLLDEPFSEVAEKDRKKIAKSMLGDDQLDAAKYPRITARLLGAEEKPSTQGAESFPYAVRLALEVHGRTVETTAAARFEATDGLITVEAIAPFRFTDFGIEPFSAFFGAVKNEDEFHVYLNLTASVPAGDPAD